MAILIMIIMGVVGFALICAYIAIENYLDDWGREQERRRRLRRRQRWQ